MPNPGVTTLATIRTAAQQRADMVNSSFLTTAEWNSNISASHAELYDLLIQKYGNDYYAALDANGNEYRLTTNGTADKYPLPDGSSTYKMPDATTAPAFYKLLGVDVYLGSVSAAGRVNVGTFSFADRNDYAVPNFPAWGGRTELKYRLLANSLWLIPLPASGQTVGLWYAPRLTALAADGDLLDGVSGWEEYIVVDAAIKALQKEESDVSVLFAQKQALIARIEAASENRDAGAPACVSDTRVDW